MQVRDSKLPEALRGPAQAAWRYFMRRGRAALQEIEARLGLPAARLTELLEGDDLPDYKSSSLLRCFRYPGILLHWRHERMHMRAAHRAAGPIPGSQHLEEYTLHDGPPGGLASVRRHHHCNALSLLYRDGARWRGAHTAACGLGAALLLLAGCARPGALCA